MSLLSTDITKLKRLSLREVKLTAPELRVETQDVDKYKLIALAQRVIKGEDSYSKEEIIAGIKEATNVSLERAERGFNLILQAGAIGQTINTELYYLGGSTPF